LVDLGRPLARGEQARLHVATDAEIFTTFDASRKDRFFELIDPGWFPVPAGAEGGAFPFSMRVKTRDPYVPVGRADRVSLQRSGEDWLLESRSDTPGRLATLLAGAYTVEEKSADGITVRVYSYAAQRKGQAALLANLALGFVQTYTAFLG